MAKAMINLKAIKPSSEYHNERKKEYDYVRKDLTPENKSFKTDDISSRSKMINRLCKEISGRKLQKNAEPIREAVVLLEERHTIEDLKRLSNALKDRFGMECFQIHLHRDEGHLNREKEWIPNYHAHMVFDYQDKTTGKTLKLSRLDYSQMQTIVAEELGMDRGELKVNSNRERLEPIEFKKQEEQKDYTTLKMYNARFERQNAELEQKKNQVIERIRELTEERKRLDEGNRQEEREVSAEVLEIINKPFPSQGELARLDENSLINAIYVLEEQIRAAEEEIDNHQG